MADTAAHLVDRVFPEVPIRQWVLSLPFALRYRLAYDSRLVSDVLRIFMQVVFLHYGGVHENVKGFRKPSAGPLPLCSGLAVPSISIFICIALF